MTLTQVQALGESWQHKHMSEESPFELGRWVKQYREIRRIIVIGVLIVFALFLAGWMVVTGVPLPINNPLAVLIGLGCAVWLILGFSYTATQKKRFTVWEEFKRNHDALVRELDIQGASASLSDIISRMNRRLEKQSGEIRKQFRLYIFEQDEESVPTADTMKKLNNMVADYWYFLDVCKHLGLIDDGGRVIVDLDTLFTPAHFGSFNGPALQ